MFAFFSLSRFKRSVICLHFTLKTHLVHHRFEKCSTKDLKIKTSNAEPRLSYVKNSNKTMNSLLLIEFLTGTSLEIFSLFTLLCAHLHPYGCERVNIKFIINIDSNFDAISDKRLRIDIKLSFETISPIIKENPNYVVHSKPDDVHS